jgi:hypothetical protein
MRNRKSAILGSRKGGGAIRRRSEIRHWFNGLNMTAGGGGQGCDAMRGDVAELRTDGDGPHRLLKLIGGVPWHA